MATIGFGSTVKVNDGASNAYVAFIAVTSVSVPIQETEDLDANHLGMADRVKEYIPGLSDSGEFTFEQHYSSAEFVRASELKDVLKSYEITTPVDDTVKTITFNGYMKTSETTFEPGAISMLKHKVKVSGAVHIT